VGDLQTAVAQRGEDQYRVVLVILDQQQAGGGRVHTHA
jgi:hypothetical protein